MASNRYFMELAIAVGKGSRCVKSKVGTVIVNNYGKIVSTAFNGSPISVCNTCENHVGLTFDTTLHSELNALLFAQTDLTNCIMYVTLSPCSRCSAAILQSRIKQVYYLFEYRDLSGVKFLRDHGVKVRKLILPDLMYLNPMTLKVKNKS